MSFAFNNQIPAANNNPSVDQPVMLQNNVSNQGIWTVDHVGFNASNGGQHQWTQFPITSTFPTPPTPSAMSSVAYPTGGIAQPSIAQYAFQNSQNTFFVNLIKAYGFATPSGIINNQSMNVSSISRQSAGIYNVTLTPNAVVGGTNFGVLATAFCAGTGEGAIAGYNFTTIGGSTFELQFFQLAGSPLTDPKNFTFIVLQV